MIYAPFVLALVFGLLVSGAIYFVVFWPQREPPEGDEPDAHEALDRRDDAGGPPA